MKMINIDRRLRMTRRNTTAKDLILSIKNWKNRLRSSLQKKSQSPTNIFCKMKGRYQMKVYPNINLLFLCKRSDPIDNSIDLIYYFR